MEIWELVDSEGHITGVLYERGSKKEIPDGMYFRVVEVWTSIGKRLLVTQRHPSKWMGLKWEVSGGGVIRGENIREAAVRELFEETGIKAEQNEISFLGVKKFGAAMVYSFVLRLPVAPLFDFDSTEVVGHKIVSRSEFEKMKNEFNLGTWSRYIEYGETVFR